MAVIYLIIIYIFLFLLLFYLFCSLNLKHVLLDNSNAFKYPLSVVYCKSFRFIAVHGYIMHHLLRLNNYSQLLINILNLFGGTSLLVWCLKLGRIVELLDALEAMAKDNQPIPPRAMILSRKYRTLVSSWIEPLQEEAELGYEIDYIARCVHLLTINDQHVTVSFIYLLTGKYVSHS